MSSKGGPSAVACEMVTRYICVKQDAHKDLMNISENKSCAYRISSSAISKVLDEMNLEISSKEAEGGLQGVDFASGDFDDLSIDAYKEQMTEVAQCEKDAQTQIDRISQEAKQKDDDFTRQQQTQEVILADATEQYKMWKEVALDITPSLEVS